MNNPARSETCPKLVVTAFAPALILLLICCVAGSPAPDPAPAQTGAGRRSRAESDSAYEADRTQKLLGAALLHFPPPQGPTRFDDLPADAPGFRFAVAERPLTGPPPRRSYETRPRVQARGPDGAVYEARLGRDDRGEIEAGRASASALESRRQRYGTHHGYAYFPDDVLIGKLEAGGLKPALRFPDVGSHTTAPHYLAIDSRGRAHLAVADVNIYQDNRLDLYWVIGDPASGKWSAAWLVDRRGFTSWSHPWSAAWGDKVHLLWDWCDVSVNKGAPGMGVFHLEWVPGGFGRKVRVVRGVVEEWGAAADPRSGRLLIVFSQGDGVYVLSRPEGGRWSRAAPLHPRLRRRYEVSAEAPGDGSFVIRTGAEDTTEWVLRPR